ncbi:two-component sensor histidine kinase [Terrihabitans soli]|uniref:histidine kinase n=1 Tax=Terrihabitans soli TaxID=708113 RepID=A0A6S6QTA5_9HYPH|nr:HAMP domain-containing sensor histidine kinase [Terrihabitans soli]BCJ90301.1 two-component sensor histidine kinase [Terrihabitans soli]
MTALVKLFRTTAFKLALGLLAVFILAAGLGLGYVVWQSGRAIQQQAAHLVDTETTSLLERYSAAGFLGMLSAIDERARQPGSFLYIVTAPNGQPITGNVATLPQNVLDKPGVRETEYTRLGANDGEATPALVRVERLPNGSRLLVGRELTERKRFAEILASTLLGGLALVIVVGLGGGLILARRVLVRLDAMTDTGRTIMAGDLSGRLPVSGSGDEFDRLADTTNQMLERIGELMAGLRQVTDDVAHDLKTPLTRLRNRAEEALRTAKTDEDYRSTLDGVIAESDDLIRIFNTMLLIARAESGAARESMSALDATELVESMAELYEPSAEEAGLALKVKAQPGLTVHGNRELIGQALANLIDNAVKYGSAADQKGEIEVSVEGLGERVRFTVADRGQGIAADDRGKVLERFVRLEESRTQPGSGLGLSLANAIARLHGGTLELADNKPGLRVVLDLPREASL